MSVAVLVELSAPLPEKLPLPLSATSTFVDESALAVFVELSLPLFEKLPLPLSATSTLVELSELSVASLLPTMLPFRLSATERSVFVDELLSE